MSIREEYRYISQCPEAHILLTQDQEIELANIIQNGSSEKERLEARNKLVSHNLKLAVSLALKSKVNLPEQDRVQIANQALVQAALNFRPKQFGTRFSTYAAQAIHNEMYKAMPQTSMIRVSNHDRLEYRRWLEFKANSKESISDLELMKAYLKSLSEKNRNKTPKQLEILAQKRLLKMQDARRIIELHNVIPEAIEGKKALNQLPSVAELSEEQKFIADIKAIKAILKDEILKLAVRITKPDAKMDANDIRQVLIYKFFGKMNPATQQLEHPTYDIIANEYGVSRQRIEQVYKTYKIKLKNVIHQSKQYNSKVKLVLSEIIDSNFSFCKDFKQPSKQKPIKAKANQKFLELKRSNANILNQAL